MIKMYEDEQIKFQGFEDYIKYVAYGDGDKEQFDDYESALAYARDYEDGYVEKVTYDHNGDEIDSETVWDGYKVIAKQTYSDGNGADNCYYDDILIYDDDEFRTGSGHTYDSCTEYANYATGCLNSDEFDENYYSFENIYDILRFVCKKMNEKFGGNWNYDIIKGLVQGEFEYVIYDTENHESLEYFEDDYFARGYDYDCYADGEYEVTVWVGDYDEDKAKKYIADATGYDEDEIWIEEMY